MPAIRIGARCLVGEKYGEIFDIAGKDFQQRWFVVKYDDGTKEQVAKGFKENAMPENINSLCFCPHCGEDLREPLIAEAAPVEEVATPSRRQIIKREVTTREIEALWGLTPLPTGMRPFGVITDGVSDVPQALACESNAFKDDKIWELRVGESKLFDPEIPTKPSVTAPSHVCNGLTTIEEREQLGNSKYGSKR